ncbi:OB-fold-containig protein [Reyranella sp.]|uniref:OB-fold-containig protein n=1 Tax=Reyranella sp. TaxID=1929291 RepID=UPI003C7ACAB8
MWSLLVAPAFQPFTIAALVMLGLLAVEIVSALFGVAASSLLDTSLGIDTGHYDAHTGSIHGVDGPIGTTFDWLNAGRVPLLVLIIAAIACFSVTGMVVQIVALNLLAPLPALIASAVALVAAVPGTRWVSRVVSRLIPRDETYVLGSHDLIGRVGTVTLGPVTEGCPARAKIQDRFGNWHFPRIRPGAPNLSIPQGASILIVDRVGDEYAVIVAEGRLAAGRDASSAF